MSILVANKGY